MDLREEDNSAPNRCHFFQLPLKYDSHQEVDRSVPLMCLQAELTVYQHRDKKWNLVSSQKSLGSWLAIVSLVQTLPRLLIS